MTLLSFDWALVIEKLILIVIIVLTTLLITLYTTFGERKVAAILQDRPGPNRAGPFGLLQPLADGLKLIMKEEIIPTRANMEVQDWACQFQGRMLNYLVESYG